MESCALYEWLSFVNKENTDNRNWFITNLRKTYGSWVAFCCFAFKTKLINFWVFEKEIWRFVNENCTVHKLLSLKETDLCLAWPQKFEKNICSWKYKLKNFSEYIWRHLKCHQHRMRNKTGILTEIILNVSKCLTISLALVRFLIWK